MGSQEPAAEGVEHLLLSLKAIFKSRPHRAATMVLAMLIPSPEPAPIKIDRLMIRHSEAQDRTALIDLFSTPEVGTYVTRSSSTEQRLA
ncbi:hypothetical protein RJP21_02855 [Paenibacillus sp. VCA1]|uniref:hypothetical protein n=1 Tax=Paenibacillus sp. VCA1 TaxID=3039148 RepID=UPI0028720ED7|nr:hypothetical protein [Paenibacillus sp. VCA1]MDR9852540.1 hypothetical protein [Paenibacillus sp. VCA1]